MSSRYLQEGEKLLYHQEIKTDDKAHQSMLSKLYAQKSNRKFLSLPIGSLGIWAYYTGKKKYNKEKFIKKRNLVQQSFDHKIQKSNSTRKTTNLQFKKQKKVNKLTSKINDGNNFMKWGDSISVFDSAEVSRSVDIFTNHLVNHGYFRARVEPKITPIKKKLMSVVYTVHPGPQYYYDSILLNCSDPTITQLIKQREDNSIPKIHDVYNYEKLSRERERIEFLLKDNGYYNFNRNYISYIIDSTSLTKHRLKLEIKIDQLGNQKNHKQSHLDSIIFSSKPYFSLSQPSQENQEIQKSHTTTHYKSITFYVNKKYNLDILSDRIFLRKGDLYNQTSFFNSQRKLNDLDMFKFVNITHDTTKNRFVTHIFTSPLPNYLLSNEFGMSVTQGYPGPYISTNLKKRNVFGGFEILEINGRISYEGVASSAEVTQVFRSTEMSGNTSLTFPKMLILFSKKKSESLARYNPKTKVLFGYTSTNRPEYQRSIVTLTGVYNWNFRNRVQYSLTLVNLNIINTPRLSNDFELLLADLKNEGNNLNNAFIPSFVSSMIFSFTWNPNYGTNEQHSQYLRITGESGGALLNIKNWFYEKEIQRQNLEPYQYLRLSADYRRHYIIDRMSSLAYRINSGIGHIYSPNRVLPYEKNFFAGGSSSVRAWRPRRLGPGTTSPKISNDIAENGYFDYQFERPGEVLIESSLEFRQKLFGFVHYALFVDVGNVWTLQTNTNKEARFRFNSFYKQFGVGSGFGLRFHFTFLILRLDAGIKVWDPARIPGEKYVLKNARFIKPYGINKEPVIYNVGIGLPF